MLGQSDLRLHLQIVVIRQDGLILSTNLPPSIGFPIGKRATPRVKKIPTMTLYCNGVAVT